MSESKKTLAYYLVRDAGFDRKEAKEIADAMDRHGLRVVEV